MPTWVKEELAARPAGSNYSVYRRTASVSIAGGGTGIADRTASGTQYSLANCTLGTSTCGAPNIDFENIAATQNGVLVTEKNVVVGPVVLSGVNAYQDSWVGGQSSGPLQHSYVAQYSDMDLKFLVTAVNPNNDPSISGITGKSTVGYGFGGTATPAGEMADLKSQNVTATYAGGFRGVAGQTGALTNLNNNSGLANSAELSGQAALTANFGAGTVTGNVFNMQRTDANNATTAATYGLRMDGTITGSTYNGTAGFTLPTTTAGASALSGTSGQMLGGFFGPKAAETAGVVRIEGTAPGTGAGTGANTTVIGGFGARKTP